MFSATKFVVAGAIAALFGGVLLTGVLTTRPAEDPLPAGDTPEPNSFSPEGALPQPRAHHSATLLDDGRVLIVGGERPDDQGDGKSATIGPALIWDPETTTFSSTGSLAEPRAGHSATRLKDGRVLIVGGYDYDDCEGYCFHQVAAAEVWDPTTETFGPAGSLAEEREAQATALLPDGRVVVAGGMGESRAARSVEVWDPATASFTPSGSLSVARFQPTITVLPDGRALIVGGEDGRGSTRTSAEIWDPRTSGSTLGASFDHSHEGDRFTGFSTTRLADGDVLIVGGEYDADPSGDRDVFRYVAHAMVWDPESGESRPAGQLAQERAFHTAQPLVDGRVLVFGGGGSPDHAEFASAELWDPATDSFVPAGSLVERRSGHTTTLLDDGRILVIGGVPQGSELTSVEVWEPGPRQPAGDDASTTDATTPDLLPGVDLVTEEVEPGVHRVLSDGVRDLTTRVHDVTVTPEGDVWLEIAEGDWWSLVRLGDSGVSERFRMDPRELGLTSDGVPAVEGTRVFDGTGWPITGLSAYDECVLASRHGAVAADGSCWERRSATLVRIEPDGSRVRVTGAELGLEPDQDHFGSPVIAPDGTVWANVGRSTDTGGVFDGLLVYAGSAWSLIPYDGDEAEDWDYRLSVRLDGVVWFGRALGSDRFYSFLAWDGEAWTDHGAAPETALPSLVGSTALAHAPDGSVWAVVDEQLHVITPEAVAAAE